jgi:NAD(P)-dependent dehydrogenase (short-subunit alcohol dehydrogenase family)
MTDFLRLRSEMSAGNRCSRSMSTAFSTPPTPSFPEWSRSERARIVIVASNAGLIGGGGGAAYTASKHAAVGYGRQLAADSGHAGIRANVIAPRLSDTPMAAQVVADPAVQELVAPKPAGRHGRPAHHLGSAPTAAAATQKTDHRTTSPDSDASRSGGQLPEPGGSGPTGVPDRSRLRGWTPLGTAAQFVPQDGHRGLRRSARWR